MRKETLRSIALMGFVVRSVLQANLLREPYFYPEHFLGLLGNHLEFAII